MNERLTEARAFFENDRFATTNGAVIEEVAEDYCVCSMKIGPDHLNARGAVMGGALFMLADFAFAVLSNFDKRPVVTLSSQITYLTAPRGDTVTARCSVVREGRSVVYYETSILDASGRLAARVVTSGMAV